MSTTTLPTPDELEMWPHVADDSPLWSLKYAADVSDALPNQEDCYRDGIDWHGIMGWLFEIAGASYLVDMAYNDHEIHMLLHRMKFRPSPMFGPESLYHEDYENERVAYETLVRLRGE